MRKRRARGSLLKRPAECFGEITCDHFFHANDPDEVDTMYPDSRQALVVLDRFTNFRMVYPASTKDAMDVEVALADFQGREQVWLLYADNAEEYSAAARALKWRLETCTPGEKRTNGLAEQCVRSVKDGGRKNMLQAGLAYAWWPWAVRHWCFARNVKTVDGTSPYFKRFDKHCEAIHIPFGALCDYMPNATDRRRPFDAKMPLGIFVG